MSKRQRRTSLLKTLDEVFGPQDPVPKNLSPKEAAMFAGLTDDEDGDCQRTRGLPRCPATEKVCFPSKGRAKDALRKRQRCGAGFLRIYWCDHCHSHHLSSSRFDKP